MTKNEISEVTGYPYYTVSKAFKVAGKISKSIAEKENVSTKINVVDYTKEEAVFAMRFSPHWTPMLEELLCENFIERKEGFDYKKYKKFKMKSDMEHFFFVYKHFARNKLDVCATCAYLIPRAWNVSRVILFRPYCTFYQSFFFNKKEKVDVYKDKCRTYKFSKRKPYVFLEAGQPQHLDIDGKPFKTTLGIPNDRFKSKRTDSGKEPVLLSKIIHIDY